MKVPVCLDVLLILRPLAAIDEVPRVERRTRRANGKEMVCFVAYIFYELRPVEARSD